MFMYEYDQLPDALNMFLLTLKLLNICDFSAPLCCILLKKILQYIDVLLNNHQKLMK